MCRYEHASVSRMLNHVWCLVEGEAGVWSKIRKNKSQVLRLRKEEMKLSVTNDKTQKVQNHLHIV